MDTALAFAMGEAHRNDPLMVFDWDKAARTLSERMPDMAFAGLEGDFEYTSGIIWLSGEPYMRDYTYLASTWAKPLLVIGDEEIECWRYSSDSPEWSADTKWPKSAMEIVKKGKGRQGAVMIDENGQMLVYIACIEWGEELGGMELLSVHDTYEGASEALKAEGYRPACVFCSLGEIYAYIRKLAEFLA